MMQAMMQSMMGGGASAGAFGTGAAATDQTPTSEKYAK